MSLLKLGIELPRYTKLFTVSMCSRWMKMLSTDGVRTLNLSLILFSYPTSCRRAVVLRLLPVVSKSLVLVIRVVSIFDTYYPYYDTYDFDTYLLYLLSWYLLSWYPYNPYFVLSSINKVNVIGLFLCKTENSITVTNAFKSTLDESSRELNKIWVDEGSEFHKKNNKIMVVRWWY